MKVVLPLCLIAGPLLAECPPPPDHSMRIDHALEGLQQAADAREAQAYTGALWTYWLDAPDALAQAMLDEGMGQRESFDFLGSVTTLTRLIEYCPDYAEGYNQRAFSYFLARDFPAAEADLLETLRLNPTHIGALSGMGLVLIEAGRAEEGRDWIRRAVELNPFLAEKALLEAPGEDI